MSPEEKKKILEKHKNSQTRRANNANASSSGDSAPKADENVDSNKSQSSVSASFQQAQRVVSQAAQYQHPSSIVVDGNTYQQCATNILYCLNQHLDTNVSGIADAKVDNLPLSTVAGLIQTTSSPDIHDFHQYAH